MSLIAEITVRSRVPSGGQPTLYVGQKSSPKSFSNFYRQVVCPISNFSPVVCPISNFSPVVKSLTKRSADSLSHRRTQNTKHKQQTQRDQNQSPPPAGLPTPRNRIRWPRRPEISPFQENLGFQIDTQMGNLWASPEFPQTPLGHLLG